MELDAVIADIWKEKLGPLDDVLSIGERRRLEPIEYGCVKGNQIEPHKPFMRRADREFEGKQEKMLEKLMVSWMEGVSEREIDRQIGEIRKEKRAAYYQEALLNGVDERDVSCLVS